MQVLQRFNPWQALMATGNGASNSLLSLMLADKKSRHDDAQHLADQDFQRSQSQAAQDAQMKLAEYNQGAQTGRARENNIFDTIQGGIKEFGSTLRTGITQGGITARQKAALAQTAQLKSDAERAKILLNNDIGERVITPEFQQEFDQYKRDESALVDAETNEDKSPESLAIAHEKQAKKLQGLILKARNLEKKGKAATFSDKYLADNPIVAVKGGVKTTIKSMEDWADADADETTTLLWIDPQKGPQRKDPVKKTLAQVDREIDIKAAAAQAKAEGDLLKMWETAREQAGVHAKESYAAAFPKGADKPAPKPDALLARYEEGRANFERENPKPKVTTAPKPAMTPVDRRAAMKKMRPDLSDAQIDALLKKAGE